MKVEPLKPSSRAFLFRILAGLFVAVAFALHSAAEAPEAPAVLPGKAVPIAVSRNMPVLGETVTVERLAPDISEGVRLRR